MSLRYRVLPDDGLAQFEISDAPFSGLLQLRNLEDPRFYEMPLLLVDVSRVSEPVSHHDLWRLASQLRVRETRRRVAILAPSDLQFGSARQFQAIQESELAVFRTLEEAVAYLGVPDLPLEGGWRLVGGPGPASESG